MRKFAAIIRLSEIVIICISGSCELNVSFTDETDKYAYLAGKRMLKDTIENGRKCCHRKHFTHGDSGPDIHGARGSGDDRQRSGHNVWCGESCIKAGGAEK